MHSCRILPSVHHFKPNKPCLFCSAAPPQTLCLGAGGKAADHIHIQPSLHTLQIKHTHMHIHARRHKTHTYAHFSFCVSVFVPFCLHLSSLLLIVRLSLCVFISLISFLSLSLSFHIYPANQFHHARPHIHTEKVSIKLKYKSMKVDIF